MTKRKHAVRVGSYWTAGPYFLSLAIRYCNRRDLSNWAQVSHQGLCFEFSDGTRERHEALASEGWCIKPWDTLDAFAHRWKSVVYVKWFSDIKTAKSDAIYQASMEWVGKKTSYSVVQIFGFAIAESFLGRILGLSLKDDPSRVICSEGACRLISGCAPEWDLRTNKNDTFDAVSPQASLDQCRVLCLQRKVSIPVLYKPIDGMGGNAK